MQTLPWLFEQAAYASTAHIPGWFRKTFPDIGFYAPLLLLVIRSGIKANTGLYTGEDWARSSECVVKILEGSGCRIEASGMEQFRGLNEPCIFIGNHMSTLETFVLPSLIQQLRDVTFVVKESLLHYPFFSNVLKSRDPVVVGRKNPRLDFATVMDGGSKCINNGRSLIIFPQSTRTPDFDPAHFNTIGVKLARKTGVPVIPIALKTDAWGNGKYLKDFGTINPARTIHFVFGESLHITGTGRDEHQYIADFIVKHLAEWKQAEDALRSAAPAP